MIKKVVENLAPAVAGGTGRSAGGRRRLLLGDRLHPTAWQGRYDAYLRAAAQTLPGDPVHGAFHYTTNE
jgi:hypothetical protein